MKKWMKDFGWTDKNGGNLITGNNTQNAGMTWGEHLLGPLLILLGQPINALKPIGALGSKSGSSIASVTLRNIPGQLPFGIRLFGTRGIGAAAGRLVPYLGWGITVLDLIITPCPNIPTPGGWERPLAPADNTRIAPPIVPPIF